MMSGNAFVVGDGFDIQSEAVLGVPLVDVDVAGAGTVGGAVGVVSGDGIFGARGFHGNDCEFAFGKMAEKFGQFGFHVARVVGVEVENLLAGSGVEAAVIFDVIVEGSEIFEAEFVRESEHLGFGLVHLLEADFVNLLGRQIGGGHRANFEAVARGSVGKGPDTGVGAAVRGVVSANEVCEMFVGGNDLIVDGREDGFA